MLRCVALWVLVFCLPVCAQSIEVLPYVQPGNGAGLEGSDTKRIIWLTDPAPAEFSVEFGVRGAEKKKAPIEKTALEFPQPQQPPRKDPPILERDQRYLRYTATLDGLPFDAEIEYRVLQGEKLIREGTFRTRSSFDQPVRFIAVGDLAKGQPAQNAVAFQMDKAQPQFLIALGDIVYPTGRALQYFNHFWKTYNQPEKHAPEFGAPLMARVPIYPVIGNHDLDSKLQICADSMAAYHFFSVPLNGPGEGRWNPPLPKEQAAAFRAMAGPNFPACSYYSFDAGAAHFLVLDSNVFDLKGLAEWIEKDLTSTKARWKFVCFHGPAFQSSREHYDQQKMRLLVPLLQKCGVDMVLAGHVHNYQRSKPFIFTPAEKREPGSGYVDGTFEVDSAFDGVTNTQPKGIIHIVSGGGGASLYKSKLDENVAHFTEKLPKNYVPYTAKYVAEHHSFVMIELTPERLELRALHGTTGEEFDKIVLTKPVK